MESRGAVGALRSSPLGFKTGRHLPRATPTAMIHLLINSLAQQSPCVRTETTDACFSYSAGACRHVNTTGPTPPAGTGSYRLSVTTTLGECAAACVAARGCVAIEWARTRNAHCEIWTVPPTHTNANCSACDRVNFGCFAMETLSTTRVPDENITYTSDAAVAAGFSRGSGQGRGEGRGDGRRGDGGGRGCRSGGGRGSGGGRDGEGKGEGKGDGEGKGKGDGDSSRGEGKGEGKGSGDENDDDFEDWRRGGRGRREYDEEAGEEDDDDDEDCVETASGLSTAALVGIVSGSSVGGICLLCAAVLCGAYHARRVRAKVTAAQEAARRAAAAATLSSTPTRAEPMFNGLQMHSAQPLDARLMGADKSTV